jgi:hypothetical protein
MHTSGSGMGCGCCSGCGCSGSGIAGGLGGCSYRKKRAFRAWKKASNVVGPCSSSEAERTNAIVVLCGCVRVRLWYERCCAGMEMNENDTTCIECRCVLLDPQTQCKRVRERECGLSIDRLIGWLVGWLYDVGSGSSQIELDIGAPVKLIDIVGIDLVVVAFRIRRCLRSTDLVQP